MKISAKIQQEIEEHIKIMIYLSKYTGIKGCRLPCYDNDPFCEEKCDAYYRALNYSRILHDQLRAQEDKEREEYRRLNPEPQPTKKPFINSYGEATTREITSQTYKRYQKRLMKQLEGFTTGR